MPIIGKYFVAIVIFSCLAVSNSFAQSDMKKSQKSEATKEIILPKGTVSAKTLSGAKAAAAPKVVVNSKVISETKKVADIQVSVLKDGIKTMPAIAGSPVLSAIKTVDSTAVVPNYKVKAFKVAAHASYYHDKLNGKRTASGKPFNNSLLTAAHRTLPFGTKLKLTNTENNKYVIVEVNDRGPFAKSREIDITKTAFMQITSNKNSGSINVTIEVVQL